MKIEDIKHKLDIFFDIDSIPADMPFSRVLPGIYEAGKIPIDKYYAQGFQANYHGLMFNNGRAVNKVYLSVFLSQEILDKIFIKNDNNVLIFSHHPAEMETSGRGFLPLPEGYLQEMKKRNISVYILHTPLDINEKMSTSASFAKKIGLTTTGRYAKDSIGLAGVFGDLNFPLIFEDFLDLISAVTGVPDLNFVKKIDQVKKIGVIAGGGTSIELIEETIALGCDTYLTGEYMNKINNDYGRTQKREFEIYKKDVNINLIECSHYASEKLVIQNEMADFFSSLHLEAEFIEQDKPWY